MKFYFTPMKKGSGGNSFSHAKGGTKRFGVVLAILKQGGGGRKIAVLY